MKWITRHSKFLRRACGCLLIGAGFFVAYWWSYKLAPMRRLADPEWRAAHSARARWQEEQKKYTRLSASPDLCFAGDKIGYYGDKEWCQWLIDKMHGGGSFRVCGCTETALMMMANRHEQSWKEWADAHRDKTQEEWIQDGFAQRGIIVNLPPQPADTVPLLEVLGHRTWNTLWGGPQGTNAPEAFPTYFQYNAFRWLRDSGFDQTTFAVSYAPALSSEVVRIGLMQYTKWNAAYPRHEGVGILAFGKKSDDTSLWTPPLVTLRFQATAWLLVTTPILVGFLVLCWRRKGVGDRVKRAAYCVTLPFRAIGRWSRKHRHGLLYTGFAAGCLFTAIAYVMLPAWLPDCVINHSTSPKRILRAAHFAFNGHFEATRALKKILGDKFDDFLLRELSDSSDAIRTEAACIFAYSRDPVAEEALIDAYLKEQSENVRRSLLFYLGWTATGTSRDFLISILDGRVAGPRWSAIRTLSWSSVPDRYEIITQYLDDPDGKVREQVADSLKDRQEEQEKKVESAGDVPKATPDKCRKDADEQG